MPTIVFDSRRTLSSSRPEATLIVPVFDVEDYIDDSLSSVLANIATVDLEVVIIDDGSRDRSAQIIEAKLQRLKPSQTLFIKQENQGLSAVRNFGMSLATGRYLGFLDSDDLLTSGVMRKLLDFAHRHHCDVVLAKSLIFNSMSYAVQPFYDHWVWDRLLGDKEMRLLSKFEDPTLFLLEPNANYRLISRELVSVQGLRYPEGLLFEDPPVHLKMLASADRIGLVNIPYYWYRVNRPGKITTQRSIRRFDAIEVARESIKCLQAMDVPDAVGGAALYGLVRAVWWCGTMTLPDHRRDFMKQASQLFRDLLPASWLDSYSTQNYPDSDVQRAVINALLGGDIESLVRISFGLVIHGVEPL